MTIRKSGRRTWLFDQPPLILTGAAVCGPKEGESPLSQDMDYIFPELRWGKNSFEQCEQSMQEKAARRAIAKAGLTTEAVDIFLSGDLINQITPSCFTARELGIPHLGLFSACATSMEALSLAALLTASGAADTVVAAASSHTCTAERQFRYPNEYGSQKPPYYQQTVTAAGAAVVCNAGKTSHKASAMISAVTIGQVQDQKICDPFQLGAAMAPAFADTVAAHLRDRRLAPDYYDMILSGDLGRDGSAIAKTLLQRQGVDVQATTFADCGLLLFGGYESLKNNDHVAAGSVFAGGSGCGCAASIGFGHLLNRLAKGELKRILLCATGALLSPVSNQQKESIPSVCHAVAMESITTKEGGVQ